MFPSNKNETFERLVCFQIFLLISILSILDNSGFKNSRNDIYPNKLELNKKIEDPSRTMFLGCSIQTND